MLEPIQPTMLRRVADIYHELERDYFHLWLETGSERWYKKWLHAQQQLAEATRQWVNYGFATA